MPLEWKLKQFLDQEGITAYRLADEAHGKLSQNGVYRLTSGDLKGIRFETLEVILPALSKLSGRKVTVHDLLEYVYEDEETR